MFTRKKILTVSLLGLMALFCCTGCGNVEEAKAAAYNAGLSMSPGVEVIPAVPLDKEAVNNNLGIKVEERKDSINQTEAVVVEDAGGGQPEAVEIVYVIDTLNSRVHKHNSGCTLLGAEDGRATIENWTDTVDAAVAAGYTKCPECIIKLGK